MYIYFLPFLIIFNWSCLQGMNPTQLNPYASPYIPTTPSQKNSFGFAQQRAYNLANLTGQPETGYYEKKHRLKFIPPRLYTQLDRKFIEFDETYGQKYRELFYEPTYPNCADPYASWVNSPAKYSTLPYGENTSLVGSPQETRPKSLRNSGYRGFDKMYGLIHPKPLAPIAGYSIFNYRDTKEQLLDARNQLPNREYLTKRLKELTKHSKPATTEIYLETCLIYKQLEKLLLINSKIEDLESKPLKIKELAKQDVSEIFRDIPFANYDHEEALKIKRARQEQAQIEAEQARQEQEKKQRTENIQKERIERAKMQKKEKTNEKHEREQMGHEDQLSRLILTLPPKPQNQKKRVQSQNNKTTKAGVALSTNNNNGSASKKKSKDNKQKIDPWDCVYEAAAAANNQKEGSKPQIIPQKLPKKTIQEIREERKNLEEFKEKLQKILIFTSKMDIKIPLPYDFESDFFVVYTFMMGGNNQYWNAAKDIIEKNLPCYGKAVCNMDKYAYNFKTRNSMLYAKQMAEIAPEAAEKARVDYALAIIATQSWNPFPQINPLSPKSVSTTATAIDSTL